MKSKEAKKYIDDNECTYPMQGYVTTITANEAVEIAETECNIQYESIAADLTKAQISDIRELSRRFDEALDVRLKIEREKAKDAFCDLCMGKCPIGVSCEKLDRFIQKIKR